MDNYVTWDELIQAGIFLVGFASFLYALFSNKRK